MEMIYFPIALIQYVNILFPCMFICILSVFPLSDCKPHVVKVLAHHFHFCTNCAWNYRFLVNIVGWLNDSCTRHYPRPTPTPQHNPLSTPAPKYHSLSTPAPWHYPHPSPAPSIIHSSTPAPWHYPLPIPASRHHPHARNQDRVGTPKWVSHGFCLWEAYNQKRDIY